jgi:hypothetical protein
MDNDYPRVTQPRLDKGNVLCLKASLEKTIRIVADARKVFCFRYERGEAQASLMMRPFNLARAHLISYPTTETSASPEASPLGTNL